MPLLLVTLWSPTALNHHINLEFVIPNISHILRARKLAARGIHFCEYRNNKTTSKSILAHCAKYYYEKCDFCWRHSGVPLHWITISIRFGIMNDDNWRGIFNKRSKAKQCNQTLNLTFENGLFNRKLQPNHANRHSMVIF